MSGLWQLQFQDWIAPANRQKLGHHLIHPKVSSCKLLPRLPPNPPQLSPPRLCQTWPASHDADDSFVSENMDLLRCSGLIEAGVPAALGGGGADVRELCAMLHTLAQGCSSTALAFAMHTHQVAIPAWRWDHTAAKPVVEPLLRRIAAEKLMLLSSGGADWVGGSGTATKVDGGYRITARKAITSGAPMGNLLMTGAISDEDGSRKVVHFAAPMSAPEVKVLDTWHTLGMRGTGSHDIDIQDLFIPDDKIALKRPSGEWHPLFQIIGTIAFPLIYAVYLGVADQARTIALGMARKRPMTDRMLRIAGQMDTTLHAARFAHNAMIDAVEVNAPSEQTVNTVMIGRRLVEENAIRTVELACELAGGAGFFRSAGLERLFRDVQGARYHPMTREAQYAYAGALALGQPVARIF